MVDLYVFRMGDGEAFRLGIGGEGDGFLGEDGEGDLAFAAKDFHLVSVFLATEVPEAGSGYACSMYPGCGYGVVGGVETLLVGGGAMHCFDIAEEVGEEVESVAGKIVEVSAEGDFGIGSPVVFAGEIEFGGRFAELPMDVSRFADGSGVEPLFDLEEARQAATVVGDEDGRLAGLEGSEDFLAICEVGRHWFFDTAGFAGCGGCYGVLLVAIGGRGDVDGVDFGGVDQFLGRLENEGDSVARGVVLGLGEVAAHDAVEDEAFGLLVGGAAFNFGDVAAADDAPAKGRSEFGIVHGGNC